MNIQIRFTPHKNDFKYLKEALGLKKVRYQEGSESHRTILRMLEQQTFTLKQAKQAISYLTLLENKVCAKAAKKLHKDIRKLVENEIAHASI